MSASKFEALSYSGTTKINNIFKKIEGPVSPAPFSTTNPSMQERASQSVSESSSVAANVKKGKINSQKSFFLQFLSQNTSERIKKKFHQNSENKENLDDLDDEAVSENSTNKTVDQSNCDNLDSNESDDEDSKNDKSTDDEEEVKECLPVEVIDISSASSSPILSSKKSHSSSLHDSNNKQPVNENILPKKLANSNFSNEKPSCSVSVNELFPDLDNVDTSVVEMLPIGIKDKVYEVLKKRKKLESDENDIEIIPEVTPSTTEDHSQLTQNVISSVSNGEKYTFCRECNRKILSVNFTEHSDYHFAMELRKQQMMEVKSSLVSKVSPTKSKIKKAQTKKRKSFEPNHSFKKIDNYFKKT